MRILVTGATGFIGPHLVARLRQDGYFVRALAHDPGGTTICPEGVESVVGDVCDAQAMKTVTAGCDAVFHLAGKADALSEIEQDEAVYRSVNVEGTRHVLEGALAGGARRFVFFSSVKAMGEEALGCLDESFEARPTTAYGRSKLAAEHLVLDYGKRSGLHVVCLRFPLVYGPGIKGNLFHMISAIDRGFFPPLPAIQNCRSMVHVYNVVQAALLAATSATGNGRCYIVTDAKAYSTTELYEMICRALGKPVPRWRIPLWALQAFGWFGDAIGMMLTKPVPFNTEMLNKLIGSAWYSSESISRDLGYRPTRSFEDALPELIAAYRSGCV